MDALQEYEIDMMEIDEQRLEVDNVSSEVAGSQEVDSQSREVGIEMEVDIWSRGVAGRQEVDSQCRGSGMELEVDKLSRGEDRSLWLEQ